MVKFIYKRKLKRSALMLIFKIDFHYHLRKIIQRHTCAYTHKHRPLSPEHSAHDKVSTISHGTHLRQNHKMDMAMEARIITSTHLIIDRQVFTIQNEPIVDPMVESIWIGVKP